MITGSRLSPGTTSVCLFSDYYTVNTSLPVFFRVLDFVSAICSTFMSSRHSTDAICPPTTSVTSLKKSRPSCPWSPLRVRVVWGDPSTSITGSRATPKRLHVRADSARTVNSTSTQGVVVYYSANWVGTPPESNLEKSIKRHLYRSCFVCVFRYF